MTDDALLLVEHTFEHLDGKRHFITVARSEPDEFGLIRVKDPFSPDEISVPVSNVRRITLDEAAEILGW